MSLGLNKPDFIDIITLVASRLPLDVTPSLILINSYLILINSLNSSSVASNIDSEGKKKRHMLSFRNYQPEMLPSLANDLKTFLAGGDAGKQCMFIQVKIKIMTTKVGTSGMYSKELMNHDQPMLVKCNPNESPEFIHGR